MQIGEQVTDRLELADLLAELFALAGVSDGVVYHLARRADAICRLRDARPLHGRLQQVPATMQRSQQRRPRHPHIIEVDRVQAAAGAHAQLLDPPIGNARRLGIDQHQTDAASLRRIRVAAGHHKQIGCLGGAGDELLRSIDDEFVTVEPRARAHRGRIRSGVRLRQGEGKQRRTGNDTG